jgi:hypothetical protein
VAQCPADIGTPSELPTGGAPGICPAVSERPVLTRPGGFLASAELGLSPRIGLRETDGKNPDGQDRAIPPRGAMGVDQRHW